MKVSVSINKTVYNLDFQPIDISIPLNFNGPQPNTYGVPAASGHAYEGQGFVGDVSRGGSCNFEEYRFIPHCNGTHTECVGHLTAEKLYIHEILKESLMPATLISVPLNTYRESDDKDSYRPPLKPGDHYLSVGSLKSALEGVSTHFLDALIVRTLPNLPDKMHRDYMSGTCPFFSNEAMAYIHGLGIQHLLVDFPSVDRLFDDGMLSNHRIYWGLEPGAKDKPDGPSLAKTITEMVFIPDDVEDGSYILEIQAAPFMADAAPSRPRLFGISPKR